MVHVTMSNLMFLVFGTICILNYEVTAEYVSVCIDDNGNTFKEGDSMPTNDPCEVECHCDNGQRLCAMMDCLPCVGRVVPETGTCCGICKQECDEDGHTYQDGEAMQSTNPCETDCFCGMGEKICAHIDCVPCKGTIIHDGSCCGICQQGCNVEGVFYEIGEEIPKSDPCLTCHCMENGEEICMSMACALCPEGVEVQHDPNECCPKCLICERSGQLFPVGPFIHPRKRCKTCECHSDGSVSCKRIKCNNRELPCRRKLRVRPKGECCKVCQCVYKRKKYMPGPFKDKCQDCVCEDGKVTCQDSPDCA